VWCLHFQHEANKLGHFYTKFLILFVICVRFEECCGRFIAVRFHEIVSFVRTFLIIVKRKSAPTFASQSFRSDWAVATGGVFDPFKEACFPSLCSSPSTDVQDKNNHDDEVYNEPNGKNVIPA